MGLLSNRIERSSLKPGDHIYSWRTAYVYAHHGIYAGDDKVIHFTRGQGEEVGTGTALDVLLVSSVPRCPSIPCPICTATPPADAHGVVSSCLDCFLAGGAIYLYEYSASPTFFIAQARGGTSTLAPSDPDQVVVDRASILLANGFRVYNVFKSNCEDFAIYCKTGLLVAEQGVVGQSGQAVSSIGGPLAAVLSISLKMVSKNVYGIVTGVGVYCASRYMADVGNRWDVGKVEVEDLIAGLASGKIKVVETENRDEACSASYYASTFACLRRIFSFNRSEASTTSTIVDWNVDRTNAFIDICMENIDSRVNRVNHWYTDIVDIFNKRTDVKYNAGQLKNKFDNMKHDWSPWNKLLQISGGFWNEKRDTVGGSDEWWDTAALRYQKYKNASPARFRELDVMFDGCIRTSRCQFLVPQTPHMDLQFDIQHYADIIKGDASAAFSRRPFRSHRPASTPFNSRVLDSNQVIVRCMEVKQEDDDYEEWEVAIVLGRISSTEFNPMHAMLDKSDQLRKVVNFLIRKLRSEM